MRHRHYRPRRKPFKIKAKLKAKLGQGEGFALVKTKLPCTEEWTSKLRYIARELPRTRCVDKVVNCVDGRLLVTANCVTNLAALNYQGQVRKYVGVVEKTLRR